MVGLSGSSSGIYVKLWKFQAEFHRNISWSVRDMAIYVKLLIISGCILLLIYVEFLPPEY